MKMSTDRDREMMLNPDKWDKWPMLPVKRRKTSGGMPDCGIILDGEGFIVFETTIWKSDFENCKQHKFNSIDELLQNGWIVD